MKTPHFSLLSLGFIAAVSAAEDVPTAGLHQALTEWSDDRPGAIVALVIDGEDSAFTSAGRWSADDDRAVDRNTHFELGSISKVFTALLAADAVGRGEIAWDQPVAGGFAESAITYAHLATHTAGLPRLPEDFPVPDLIDPYAEVGMDYLQSSFTRFAAELTADDLPAGMAYSNLGPAVLGQAVAAEVGASYPEAVIERVFSPLGMKDTWYSGEEKVDTSRMAPGHNSAGVAKRWRFDAFGPAGAWVSTAADMERFMRATLALGKGRGQDAWRATMAERAATPGPDRMGYGWFIREINGHDAFWHAGGTGGYRTFVGVQPDTDRAILVMGARDEDVAGIGMGWLQGWFDEDESDAVAQGADSASVDLSTYAGDYPLAPEFVISVFVEDGRLRAQATGQPSFGLRPDGTDRFTFEGVAARLSFERDDSGKVTGLILHQGGRDMPANWNEPGSLRIKPKGVELTPEQLAGLAGDYELAPSMLVSVTVSGTEVFVQLTGQPNFPVFASAADEFFYEVVDAQISFQRDENGEVTGLILHQNGRDLPAPKR